MVLRLGVRGSYYDSSFRLKPIKPRSMHDQADPGIGSRAGGEIRIPDLRLQRLAVPPTPTPMPTPSPSPSPTPAAAPECTLAR